MTSPAPRSLQNHLDAQAGRAPAETAASRLARARDTIFETLCQSQTFRANLMDYRSTYAMFFPVVWEWSPWGDAAGHFSVAEGRMTLDEFALDLFGIHYMTRIAAHEYRHAWQYTKKVLNRYSHDFADTAIHTRKVEADAVAFELTVAFELYQKGLFPEDAFFVAGDSNLNNRFFRAARDNPASLAGGSLQNTVVLDWCRDRDLQNHYSQFSMGLHRAFNSKSALRRASLLNVSDDDTVDLDKTLFAMPYIDETGTMKQRSGYGAFLKTERAHIEAFAFTRDRVRLNRANRLRF